MVLDVVVFALTAIVYFACGIVGDLLYRRRIGLTVFTVGFAAAFLFVTLVNQRQMFDNVALSSLSLASLAGGVLIAERLQKAPG